MTISMFIIVVVAKQFNQLKRLKRVKRVDSFLKSRSKIAHGNLRTVPCSIRIADSQ